MKSGEVFREMFRLRDGKVVSTKVYSGWNVPHPVAGGEHKDPAD